MIRWVPPALEKPEDLLMYPPYGCVVNNDQCSWGHSVGVSQNDFSLSSVCRIESLVNSARTKPSLSPCLRSSICAGRSRSRSRDNRGSDFNAVLPLAMGHRRQETSKNERRGRFVDLDLRYGRPLVTGPRVVPLNLAPTCASVAPSSHSPPSFSVRVGPSPAGPNDRECLFGRGLNVD